MNNTDDTSTGANDVESHGIFKTRLLIVSDQINIREELKRVFAQSAHIEITAEATNGEEMLQQLKSDTFDLLLVDMDMSDGNSIGLIKSAKVYKPELPIVISIRHNQAQIAILALIAGASGFIAKNNAPEVLLAAIHAIAVGDIYIDPILAEQMNISPQDQLLHTLLSIDEFTVFLHLGIGRSIEQIAEELPMSIETVNNHKMHIMKKMNLQDIEDMMRYAVQHGFAD